MVCFGLKHMLFLRSSRPLTSLGVVSLGPVISGSGLSEDKVVGAEELSEGSGTDGVHGSGLEVHQDGAGDIASAGGLVEVDVDPLKLEVGVSVVGSRGGKGRKSGLGEGSGAA